MLHKISLICASIICQILHNLTEFLLANLTIYERLCCYISSFDSWAYLASIRYMSPTLTTIMKFITDIGSGYFIIFVCLVLLAIPWTRKNYALRVIVSVIIAAALNLILKNIFQRPRPDILRLVAETDYSFPSGHAMNNIALYGSIVLISWEKLKNLNMKIVITCLSVILVGAIGFSRVYLGVHYASDIIGGWAFGLIVVWIVFKTLGKQKTTVIASRTK